MIQAGYINKEMAGVYDFLPLGLMVRKKIEDIIREEMNAVGGQEVNLTALQEQTPWLSTERWNDEIIDVWFKTELKNGTEVGLATTHEEPLTKLLIQHLNSYRDFPVAIYQIQTKFRNELRAKSGILRGREFLMKDLYSFSRTKEEHDDFYEQMADSYRRIFARVGIGQQTFYTYASGGSFSSASHEFQTVTQAGEDTILIADSEDLAINKEMENEETLAKFGLADSDLREETSVEVGNIFPLGTKFSKPLGLTFADKEGNEQPVVMGSYGIGIGRLMGAIVEVMADDDGLVWPKSVAPFAVHLLVLSEDEVVMTEAKEVYKTLTEAGVEVLLDDRSVHPGEKFADSDLLGIPTRVIVSEKTMERGALEVVERKTGEESYEKLSALIDRFNN